MSADRARDVRGPRARPAGCSTGFACVEEEREEGSSRQEEEMPSEEVLDEGSIATPAGGATDEDIDALLASFSAARERAQAEEGARTVVMRVPEWLTQDTAHAGAERSNLVGALLESIDVPWTERTQSIYVRHLPARTIGFTYGAGSRGQAGTVTPVPYSHSCTSSSSPRSKRAR